MDNLYGSGSPVAVGNGYFIYNGRADPYSARNCNNSSSAAGHFGAESLVETRETRHLQGLKEDAGNTAVAIRRTVLRTG
jgi:hypothetical protein